MNLQAIAAKAAVLALFAVLPLFAQDLWSDSSIQTTAPKAGTIYHIGDTITTQFTIHPNDTPGGGLVVSISLDMGYNWVVIITETLKKGDTKYYLNDSMGQYKWVVPDSIELWIGHSVPTISDSCMMAVGAPYDEVFASSYSGVFSIKKSSAVKMPFQSGHRSERLMIDKNSAANSRMLEVFSINGRLLRPQGASMSPGLSIARIQSESNTPANLQIRVRD